MQLKCKCGAVAAINIEDEITATLACPNGHRTYYFRTDSGAWENQEARRERLNKYRVCEECEFEYMTSDHPSHVHIPEIAGRLCPRCAAPIIKLRIDKWRSSNGTRRDNSNSPWRKPRRFQKRGSM